MNINLLPYSDKRICVAVSGGKDSMALLHYLHLHCAEFGIVLSALNCDHGIRGDESARDSAFVAAYCGVNCIPLYFFKAKNGTLKSENEARAWRLKCYDGVLNDGKADAIATAHHMNDNAETVLFNLARGAGLSGVKGITDSSGLKLIRPLIGCSRGEIDEYISEYGVPFVTDETNFTEDYTRNKIRLNVLPALEDAVPGAVRALYRFSRLAADDEEYFSRKAQEIIIDRGADGFLILPCGERVIFKRAAHAVIAGAYKKKDYTAEQFEKLFALQSAECGKRFEFLGLTAVKEVGGIAIAQDRDEETESGEIPFADYIGERRLREFCGRPACVADAENAEKALAELEKIYGVPLKILRFDGGKIPDGAVVRFKRGGDRFTKFGGGSKALGDYLTDKKVPQTLRRKLPLVCIGNEVLIVGGVEISDKVKVTESTENARCFICADCAKI